MSNANEQTSDAIVLEMMWLHRGQCKAVPYTDDFNQPAFRYEPQAAPMDLRAARALAFQRAATWGFACPDIPKAPTSFRFPRPVEPKRKSGRS